jgi:hypothetical protein
MGEGRGEGEKGLGRIVAVGSLFAVGPLWGGTSIAANNLIRSLPLLLGVTLMPKRKAKVIARDKDLPISDYVSSLVASVVAKSESLASVYHPGIKGHFNEILAKDLLIPFLPDFLKITSGKIILRRLQNGGKYKHFESKEQDAIVFDSRLLPPFIEMQGVGYVPLEAAIATLQVKFRKKLQTSTVKAAVKSQEAVGRPLQGHGFCLLHAAILFGRGMKDFNAYKPPLKNAQHMRFLCIPGAGCWKKLKDEWEPEVDSQNDKSFEGTKGFIATFVDNCRTYAERRYRILCRKGHHDWLSHYIRTQNR